MATLDFFRNTHYENEFFDEGPKVVIKVTTAVNSSSIDTSGFDSHRQGVELSTIKHFDAGTVKIHAGEPGHVMRRNRYGMDKNFRTAVAFAELDYFSPIVFLNAQATMSPLLRSLITFPIITSDNDHIENYVYNGVIEPLTIRSKASFYSIEVPFESHDVRGGIMNGNVDITGGSDLVLTITRKNDLRLHPYVDAYIDTLPFPELQIAGTGSQHVQSTFGIFEHIGQKTTPFSDTRYVANVTFNQSTPQAMIATMTHMSGSTENYVDQNSISATSGWVYDDAYAVGTDSLSFGGMTY